MLTIVLGLATSLVYGFADFFGALASRRIRAVRVTFLAGVIGLLLLLALTPALGATFTPAALTLGIAAGVASAAAMSCLYASLAIGPISIVSPLGAVVSAIVPAAVGFAGGDRFSALGWLGILAVLVAVVFVGFVPGADVRLPSLKGVLLGVAAGAGIGVVLICLDAAPAESGLAPVILLRGVSAALLGLGLLGQALLGQAPLAWRGRRLEPDGKGGPTQKLATGEGGVRLRIWAAVIVAGLCDSSANVFFLLASRSPEGNLTVVSVLTALYPLGTIVLARLVLRERIARIQLLGIVLALAGSVLLVLS